MDMRSPKCSGGKTKRKKLEPLESPQKALESPLVLLEELFGAVEMMTFKKR